MIRAIIACFVSTSSGTVILGIKCTYRSNLTTSEAKEPTARRHLRRWRIVGRPQTEGDVSNASYN